MSTPPGSGDAAIAIEMERRLRASERELSRLHARLERIEGSTAYQVAEIVVRATRDPRRAAVAAPRDLLTLLRRWRARGGGAGTVAAPSTSSAAGSAFRAAATDALGAVVAEELGVRLGSRAVPVVAGVLHPRTSRTLSSVLSVSGLLPTGGRESLDRIRPDLLVVDASAFLVGPWSGAGGYENPRRGRQLLEILSRAVELGVTTVLWDPLGRHRVPFLHEVATFQQVLSPDPALVPGAVAWDPGVDLAEHVRPPGGVRVWDVVVAGDVAATAQHRDWLEQLAGCTDLGLTVLPDAGQGAVPAPLLRATAPVPTWATPWRHTRVAIPLPLVPSPEAVVRTQLVAALVAGARVAARPTEGSGRLAEVVTSVERPEELGRAVADELAAGPLPAQSHQTALREAFLLHAAPVRAAQLLRLTGIDGRPDDARAVSVLVPSPASAQGADRWIGSLLAQHWRPAHVLVADPETGHAGRVAEGLARGGQAASVVRVGDRSPWWVELARRATTEWVHATEAPLPHPTSLLDLAVAAETSSAGTSTAGTWSGVPPVPVEGALLRRDAVLLPTAVGRPA